MTQEQVLQTVARLDERLNNLEQQTAENKEVLVTVHKMSVSLDNIGVQLEKTNSNMEKMCSQQSEEIVELRKYVDEKIREQVMRLDGIEKKPGEQAEKNREAVKAAAISAVVSFLATAIAAYLLINLGPY